MRNTSLLSLALLLLASCATKNVDLKTRTDEPQGPAPTPSDGATLAGSSKVYRHIFDNGLRLLVVEDHSAPTLAYYTFFKVGSRDETPGYTGLAHLFEHMMFKGTPRWPDGQFDKVLQTVGVEGINAGTSQDFTVYTQELPKEQLNKMAEMEADRMVNLIVNDKSFKTELEVVQNERRYRMENSPDGLMYQELMGIGFEKHSYHWPVIGYEEDLNRMSAEDARKFYQAHYAPNNATIAIVGDVTFEEAKRVVKRHYGSLKPSVIQDHSIPEEPAQKQARRKTMELNIQVEKLIMGYRVPALGHPDNPALAILGAVLWSGNSSRLERALVETGMATGVSGSTGDGKDPGLSIISVNLQKGKHAVQAEKIILSELDNLSRRPISKYELERARNQLEFEFFDGLGSNRAKANFIGYMEAVGKGFEQALEFREKLRTVTEAQVQEVARKYTDPQNRTVIIGVPK